MTKEFVSKLQQLQELTNHWWIVTSTALSTIIVPQDDGSCPL